MTEYTKIKYSDSVSSIESPKTIVIADRVRKLEREGKEIIKLQTGDPDFESSGIIREELFNSLNRNETHYCNSQGLPELRKSISGYLEKLYDCSVDYKNEVIVTAGGIHGIFLGLAALLNRNDEVVLLEPYFPQYRNIVSCLGGRPVIVPMRSKKPTLEIDYDNLKQAITARTKAIIINSPNNPSGKVYSHQELEKLLDIVKDRRDLFILTDEVYSSIIDSSVKHVSLLEYPEFINRIIYVNSFSKIYAMTGYRLGYVFSNNELIANMLKLMRISTTCVPAFTQRAGIAALENCEVAEYSSAMVNEYNRRRRIIYDLIKDDPCFKIYPEGGFYYLLYLENVKTRHQADKWTESLLNNKFVAAVPGYVYGDSLVNYIRITFAVDIETVREGIKRIKEFDGK